MMTNFRVQPLKKLHMLSKEQFVLSAQSTT